MNTLKARCSRLVLRTRVNVPGHIDWETYHAGDDFEVPGDSSFNVKVTQATAYLCDYL